MTGAGGAARRALALGRARVASPYLDRRLQAEFELAEDPPVSDCCRADDPPTTD